MYIFHKCYCLFCRGKVLIEHLTPSKPIKNLKQHPVLRLTMWSNHATTICIFFFRWKRVYKKNAKRWSVYATKVPKTYGYITELQTRIVGSRLAENKGMPQTRPDRPEDAVSRRLGPLAPIPPPPTAELAERLVRRGASLN